MLRVLLRYECIIVANKNLHMYVSCIKSFSVSFSERLRQCSPPNARSVS